jgi:hypothetical protein
MGSASDSRILLEIVEFADDDDWDDWDVLDIQDDGKVTPKKKGRRTSKAAESAVVIVDPLGEGGPQ